MDNSGYIMPFPPPPIHHISRFHGPQKQWDQSGSSWMPRNMENNFRHPPPGYHNNGDPNPNNMVKRPNMFPIPQQRSQYYNLEDHKRFPAGGRKLSAFTCEVCSKSFNTKFMYQKHIDEHVECPFPECRMKAHIKVIDQHITNQHMLVNFESIQMDDGAWISQRKRKFPSVQRAESRRAELEERINRGERIGIDKKRFPKDKRKSSFKQTEAGNPIKSDSSIKEMKRNIKTENVGKITSETNTNQTTSDKKTDKIASEKNNKFQDRRKGRKQRRNMERNFEPVNYGPPKPLVEVDLYDSDYEMRYGLKAFKGTKKFYEDCGELSYFSNLNTICSESERKLDISDEEEWETQQPVEENNVNIFTMPVNNVNTSDDTKLKLHNALGSLMGAYDSDTEGENTMKTMEHPGSILPSEKIGQEHDNNITMNKSHPNTDNTDATTKSEVSYSNKRKRTRKRRHDSSHINNDSKNLDGTTDVSEKRPKKMIKPPVAKKRKPTLLQRLLEPDIRHERNVLLQCIRYIVENNFFQEPISKTSTESNNEKS